MLNSVLIFSSFFIVICVFVFCWGRFLNVIYRFLRRIFAKVVDKHVSTSKVGSEPRLSTTDKISVTLSLLSLLIGFYSWYVEPYWPEVEHIQIATAKMAPGSPPVRIVFITDSHSESPLRVEKKIPKIIQNLSPDIILFGGDTLNTKSALPDFKKMLRKLSSIAPTYSVLGNWDIWFYAKDNLFGDTSVVELDNEQVEQSFSGLTISIAGFPVLPGRAAKNSKKYERRVLRLVEAMPHENFSIFLHHYPEVAAIAVENGVDLGLGGDTHGGQVHIPFLGPIVRISRLGGFFTNELHKIASGYLYVNRGLGLEGGGAPRVRFLCRPEITLIEIRSAGKKK